MRIIRHLSNIQDELDIRGSVGEIGVHHGKLFILLHLMLREDEWSFAIDVFEQQELNLDKSGHGSKSMFLKNLEKFGGNPDYVAIMAKSSLDARPEEILARVGKVRLFSVDGGHTADIVANDLALAEACLSPGGIVVLDDYFNPNWPDVSVGTMRFFEQTGSPLRPFALGQNKLLLAHENHCDTYRRRLLNSIASHDLAKEAVMMETPVLVFAPPKPCMTVSPATRACARTRTGMAGSIA